MSNDTRPEIRFPGFTEDWEERKLGELTESFDGKRVPIDSDLRISGKYPYYGATGIIDYVDDYIFNGEYVLLAEDGANIIMRNYPVAYLTQGKFWLNNHAHIMRMRNGSNYFLVQVLEKIDYKKYNTGTAQPKLNSKIVKNIELKIPHIEEQQQIGNFFKQLDDIIALHQRKLDLLKETKKGFLQKMFPKNGAKVPEIRFPGFTEDWEERRLKQLGEIQTGNTPPTNDTENYNKNGIMWVTPTDINNLVISDTAKKLSEIGRLKARIAMKGSILVTCIASIGKNTLALSDVGFNQQINALTPNKEFDSYFLLSQSGKWSEKMKILAGRGTMQIVNKTDFSNITTYVPKYREQVKIGHFFKQLDDTIMLHQRKLDLLKKTKKGFLQKMFV
ncbi:restriction endonuclease subunit S [Enterococcus casseliflavus]|uniref:Restriction endonuclease subunit S n=1 Tax=Enterococcus casseliflavus TaxID=37734 RepID=A0ABD6YWN4_ENTCA|nr:restriction endonuclease subunit S [Enterococcus casseliflavus]QGN28442.1 restriction endonuclease subunit S [Enterococcus casseliflavus]